MLEIGDTAPDFTLLDQNGKSVTLNSFLSSKVLIWFYPKASTPGCTAEGCSLRDDFEELTNANIKILGISMDSVKRQLNFSTKQKYPYQLLADTEGEVVRAYGVWGPKKFMGKEYDGIHRKSFLIDEEGKILHIFHKVKTKTHGKDVLEVLQSRNETKS